MSLDLEILIKDMLSPFNDIRKAAETKFNYFFDNIKVNDLDNLLNYLINTKNEDTKIFICVIIKKFILTKINQNNNEIFIQYFSQNKIKFIEILFHKESTIRLIKNLLACFFDALSILKTNESLCLDNILDIFSYFSQYYSNKKKSNEIKDINRCLFIFKKFIKFISKITVNQKLENTIKNFYTNIIADYKMNIANIINGNLNKEIFILVLESAIYYLKLFKHSNTLVDDACSDIILNNTYELNVYILNQLISNSVFNDNEISKFIFDIIFLSNKIIILYISQVSTLSIQTLQKFADIFYIYVKEENVFNYINNILQNSKNISENMENKFLFDIINFFYELLQLCSIQEFTDLQIFGKGFTENAIEISDFFGNKYWDKEKIKNLLLFILKNYFSLKPKEIMLGQNEPEEFYLLFYNSDSNHYDLRGIAGKVCRIIYDIFGKEIKDIYLSFENELFSLTKLEYDLINKNQHLTDNQINLKLSLLLYYYHVDTHFSSKKLDKQKWLEQILLSQIDTNVIIKKNEIFSTFFIMYILTKINSYVSDSKDKYIIFIKIMNLFICKNFNNFLINLSCIDYIFDYVEEEEHNIELPKNIINNYVIKICQILEEVSSPDIHNKILETTNNLLKKTIDDELSLIFPEIFPTLKNIWENNSNNININNNYNNGNKLILIRSNLIKLIEFFVKKAGFFISYDNNNNDNNINNNIINPNFYENYFNFIYQMLGYSIDVKIPYCDYLCKSALNLIIFIQDDFFNNSSLSLLSNINELHNALNASFYFNYFIKTYQYLDILLSNLSNSNQYFILQFAVIEQFISFSFEKEISNILENINFIDKIIYIFNFFIKNFINQYNLYIFNIIEYVYYIVLSQSKMDEQHKKKLNDFIYQIIQNIFGDNNFENQINNLIEKYEKNLDNIYYCRDDDIYLINIYIGIIQLTNRYIFINASNYKYINNDLNIFLAKKIIALNKFLTQKNNVLNIIQKNILRNSVFNLKFLLNENIDKNLYNTLNEIYKNISKSNYISKSDKILSHWLYFFNKIYNDYFCSKLDGEEETLKYHWKKNIEKDVQLIDTVNKDYKIKYLMIASDPMYENEK